MVDCPTLSSTAPSTIKDSSCYMLTNMLTYERWCWWWDEGVDQSVLNICQCPIHGKICGTKIYTGLLFYHAYYVFYGLSTAHNSCMDLYCLSQKNDLLVIYCYIACDSNQIKIILYQKIWCLMLWKILLPVKEAWFDPVQDCTTLANFGSQPIWHIKSCWEIKQHQDDCFRSSLASYF